MIHGICSLFEWVYLHWILSFSLSHSKQERTNLMQTYLPIGTYILENTLRQEDLLSFFFQTCPDWQLICTSQPRLHFSSIGQNSILGLFDHWDSLQGQGRKYHRTECWATLYRGKNIEHDTRQHKIYAWLVYKYVKKRRNLHWVEAWERWLGLGSLVLMLAVEIWSNNTMTFKHMIQKR